MSKCGTFSFGTHININRPLCCSLPNSKCKSIPQTGIVQKASRPTATTQKQIIFMQMERQRQTTQRNEFSVKIYICTCVRCRDFVCICGEQPVRHCIIIIVVELCAVETFSHIQMYIRKLFCILVYTVNNNYN